MVAHGGAGGRGERWLERAARPPEGPETGFDPSQTSDLYSSRVIAHIYEGLLGYDSACRAAAPCAHHGRGDARCLGRLQDVDGAPQTRHPVRDDLAFKGKPRELVAADYVFALKRVYDPTTKSPHYQLAQRRRHRRRRRRAAGGVARKNSPSTTTARSKGCARSIATRSSSSSPRGGRVSRPRSARPSRWASRRKWSRPMARTFPRIRSAPARIELKSWRHTSRIVLDKNPRYREVRYDSQPAADDAEALAWAKRLNGKRLPLNDGVEISIVEESQPRWLSFLSGQADFARVPPELSLIAAPNGKIAPNLARQNITLERYVNTDTAFSYFNMEDPVVGGYSAEKVALRRAISLSYDIEREINIIRRGNAIAAQAPMAPHTFGLRSGISHREQHPRCRPREGPARHVRLPGPRRRRLARAARWKSAGDHDVDRAAANLPRVQRELAEQLQLDRRARALRDGTVGRALQGLARRQASDVVPGRHVDNARRPGRPADDVR